MRKQALCMGSAHASQLCINGFNACRARHESGARKALGEGVLQQVEQTDLMSYGLIPEFVGRFPIITALHVSTPLSLVIKPGQQLHGQDEVMLPVNLQLSSCWGKLCWGLRFGRSFTAACCR